jgi:glycosyltransferase involved in cell wall biosynthesis
MKCVLMVTYLFPPVGGLGVAGSQRLLKFAKYLPSHGWRPIVLTVKEQSYESYFSVDPSLVTKIPSDSVIVRTRVLRWLTRLLEFKGRLQGRGSTVAQEAQASIEASLAGTVAPAVPLRASKSLYQSLKDGITDLFEIPDEEMGWIVPGILAGLSAFRRHGYEVIFATGRPWTALVIGLLLRRLTGKPLIVDFRDPWMTNPFRLRYSPMRNRIEGWLERQVIEQAATVIANTHELRAEFIERFPNEPAEKFVTMLNGFDPDDFILTLTETPCETRAFTLTHTGFLYGKRDPKNFLEAVRLCLSRGLMERKKLRILLVGAAELPYNLADYLKGAGLSDVVQLQGHLPYRESLHYLYRSDALLLLQPGTKTQVPSKLFDYIGVGKPILGVSPLDGATSRLLMQHRLGAVADPDHIPDIAQALARLYKAWDSGSLDALVDRASFHVFDVRHVTGTLAARLSMMTAA